MAVVYLAHDQRHDRKVALKVLHPELAANIGTDRFLAEIRTTANLQHPHILPLYDSGIIQDEQAEGDSPVAPRLLYYVMPYVAGESLRQRLERERQLPIAVAVNITREVADALDYAHRHGVIHRDIKPENVLLHEGRALVADFGIALAASRREPGSRLTETGMSIGTPQYMSPEQALGERHLTGAADIYSLGVVLYEMLGGHPPFAGSTAQAIVAQVITERPIPLRAIRDTVPQHVDDATLTALQKLPADRFESASAFAAALTGGGRTVPAARAAGDTSPIRLRTITGVAAGVLLGGLIGAWGVREMGRAAESGHDVARAVIPLADGELLSNDRMPFDISADGSTLAYIGVREGQRRIFIRPISSLSARELEGTEGAIRPFFSPDGKWVAYFARGRLLKLPVTGGAPDVIAPAPGVISGANWAADGTILFSLNGPFLYRVRAEGGKVDSVECRLQGERAAPRRFANPVNIVRWPQLLPDGKHVLLSTLDGIGVLTLATGVTSTILPRGDEQMSQAWYVPTGHLVYDGGEGRIRVIRFDPDRLEVSGKSMPAFEAFRGPGAGAVFFAISRTGTLVYVPGGFNRTLVLVDRYGRETPIKVEPRGYRFPRFSPDGKRIAVTVDPRPSRIWIVDLEHATAEPLSPDGGHGIVSVWSPDGKRLAWSNRGIVWVSLGSPAGPAPVLADTVRQDVAAAPNDWSADGTIVASQYGLGRIATYRIGDSTFHDLIPGGSWSREPSLSPDGKWIAYSSDATGAYEVYVRAWKGEGTGMLVSVGGGGEPRWSHDGAWLYYRRGRGIVALPVRTGTRFTVLGAPSTLFEGTWDFSQNGNWDVDRAGRFVMVRGDPTAGTQFLVVFNWFDELRRMQGGA
jgi:serine/threonine-protein kinase